LKRPDNSSHSTAEDRAISRIVIGFVSVVALIVVSGVAYGLFSEIFYYSDDAPSRLVQRTLAKAEDGDSEAQYLMAQFLQTGRINLPADAAASHHRFAKAAAQGHVGAKFELGQTYRYGLGVVQNFDQALASFRDAESAGSLAAKNAIGELYNQGQGVEQEFKMAVSYFRVPAEAGYARAQRNMALSAFNGKGMDRDPALAHQWYLKAAEQDDVIALHNLGIMYEHGQAVTKDLYRAHGCYFQALLRGYDPAAKGLERLRPYALPKSGEHTSQYTSCVTGEVYSIQSRPRLRP
jgi:TPR repeat protein